MGADVTGPGVEMCLYTLSDCGFVSPGYHGVQKPVAATTCEILVTKA
jgi:hypothetical protein